MTPAELGLLNQLIQLGPMGLLLVFIWLLWHGDLMFSASIKREQSQTEIQHAREIKAKDDLIAFMQGERDRHYAELEAHCNEVEQLLHAQVTKLEDRLIQSREREETWRKLSIENAYVAASTIRERQE